MPGLQYRLTLVKLYRNIYGRSTTQFFSTITRLLIHADLGKLAVFHLHYICSFPTTISRSIWTNGRQNLVLNNLCSNWQQQNPILTFADDKRLLGIELVEGRIWEETGIGEEQRKVSIPCLNSVTTWLIKLSLLLYSADNTLLSSNPSPTQAR
jgi:hypothetical protein